MRALRRTAELEKARNDAHHMVVILLTLVDKLHRDIATLTAERNRATAHVRPSEHLNELHEQLRHSEAQRTQAETELHRARVEREKADRLAEQSTEQVRKLTAELARLRRQHGTDDPSTDAVLEQNAPALALSEQQVPDDIEVALLKAAHILDTGAERLDQLAEELREEHEISSGVPNDVLDNLSELAPDKLSEQVRVTPAADGDVPKTPDNQSDNSLFGSVLPPEGDAALDASFPRLIAAAKNWSAERIDLAVRQLRTAAADDAADALLLAIGTARPAPDLIAVLGKLERSEVDVVLRAMAADRPARHFHQAVHHFRISGLGRLAGEALLAAGQLRSLKDLPLLLSSVRSDQVAGTVLLLNGVRRKGAAKIAQSVERLRAVGMRQEADILRITTVASLGPVFNGSDGHPWGHEAWFSPNRRIRREPAPELLRPETALTTRIRINIPGSRPIPPVAVRKPVGPPEDLPSSG
ncbi:hypothetical protein SUDANB176_07834 (plasmid) [Streptomyces sp. enrichment culture]|uniref:hypothetical protein n=1 Tax=Streptomyces sp. enrichment culture TaxID=1795815 RepID=UPI003F56F3BD